MTQAGLAHQLGDADTPGIPVRHGPAGPEILAVEMDERQAERVREASRQRALARAGAADDENALHCVRGLRRAATARAALSFAKSSPA